VRDRVVERLGEARALLRRRRARVLAEHEDRRVVDVEARQQDAVDDLDQLLVVVLEFGLVALDRLAEVVGDALHDRVRRRRVGASRNGGGDTEQAGEGEAEHA